MKNKLLFFAFLWFLSASIAFSQTTTIKGLTVMVEFSDFPFPEPIDSVSMMMNQPGFSGWGNEGSVRDFFYVQSDEKVLITSTVIKVTLPHPWSYYYVDRTGSDVVDVVALINQQYPDGFLDLTLKPDNSLKHFNLLTKAGGGAWAFGTQAPNLTIKNNGVPVLVTSGNITNYHYTDKPEHNTVCHEMGHNIMEWPDHYQTAWSNLGNYCVMGSAGNRKGPQMINPALRLQKGWIDQVIEIGTLPYDQTYVAAANSYNTIYKYTNPSNPKEYLLIHPQIYGEYYQQYLNYAAVADQGLAIYYVDEQEGMDIASGDDDYFVKLLQADNLDEMHDEDLRFASNREDIRGDFNDLYDHVYNTFPAGTPFRWKDGGAFGLHIGDISAPGPLISFTVYARSNTHIATSDLNGNISPKGVLDAYSQLYTLTPKPGYEVDQVNVNGNLVAVSGNTFSVTGSGAKQVHATFKRKSSQTPLPSPWQQTDIGSPSVAGFSAHEAGTFRIENHGHDIWGNSDQFHYVYRAISGDVTMVAKVSYLNRINQWSKAGIMIRESLQPNAAYSMLMYTPRNHVRVQQRASTGAYAIDNPDGISSLHFYTLYRWLKVTRIGNTIYSYASRDQVNWVLMGQEEIALGANVYIGLAVTGVNGTAPALAEFEEISLTYHNTPPSVSIATPAHNENFLAPATVNISANASDADGSVTHVEFYLDSTLVNTDYTTPYSYTLSNVSAGNYTIRAKAYDNEGASQFSEAVVITVALATADLTGPACGNNNADLTYELSATKRVSATSYNWWYSGSSQNLTAVSGSPYQAVLATGNNFTSGQVCVGVNYSVWPWYSSYCVNVSVCSGTKAGTLFEELYEESISSYPNPFAEQTVITLPSSSPEAYIQIYNMKGLEVFAGNVQGQLTIGENMAAGMYLVKIFSNGTYNTLKIVKQ
jgi:M6 family metalloprotease-like protein